MKQIPLLILFSMILSVCAHGIGRTGNGIYDNEDGFKAQIPMEYSITQSMGDGNLRVIANNLNLEGENSGVPNALEILKVREIFPEFSNYKRKELINLLLNDNWRHLSKSPSHECIEFFEYESKSINSNVNTVEGLVLWGSQKGILIRGLKNNSNHNAIKFILSSLKLTAGVCDWN